MAIEYNNIILNIDRRPSSKYILIAIPFYMFRVETNEFSHGLNFFQKIVLKFKVKPGIKDETIADYLGLDQKLIAIVITELSANGYINEHGSLSDKGKEKLNEVDGLVVDSSKKKIGYVLQYPDQDKIYQYYVTKIFPADISETEKGNHPKIVTGTKGDGEDYTDMPFFLDEIVKNKISLPRPSEKIVLQLINNSNTKPNKQTDIEKEEKISNQLAVRFLNEQPELIWVATYVYLEQREDDTFEPDWRILDPFGYGDNVALKYYLNRPLNKRLLESIDKRFADTKTINGKLLSDFQDHLSKLVSDKLSDFNIGFEQLDENLRIYLNTIVKNYILQQNHNYTDLDSSVSFSLNLQNVLENILKHDRENRLSHYNRVYEDLDLDPAKKRLGIIGIYRQKLLSKDTQVPQSLLNTSKGNLKRGSSLLSYLVSFILTYNYDNKSALFKVFNGKIDNIIEIAQLRNEKGHGQTKNEKTLTPLTKSEVERYYEFIKSLINDYIQNQ